MTSPSPAGFWKRYVAYSIDLALLSLVLEAALELLFSATGSSLVEQLKVLHAMLQQQQAAMQDPMVLIARAQGLLWRLLLFSTAAYAVLGAAYFAICEASPAQATLGKWLVGIKVTDRQGRRISPARALARFFAAALSWLSLNLGHALAAWTPEKRALHDYVAGTRVENREPEQTAMPAWGWLVVGVQALLLVLFFLGSLLLTIKMLALAGGF